MLVALTQERASALSCYSHVPNNHIAPNKGIARKNDKKIINVSGPNKHIAGKTLKFTSLNYLRLCHYFVTTSKYKNDKLKVINFIFY